MSDTFKSLCVLGAALAGGFCVSAQEVTLHFNHRPPYLMEASAGLTGLTGTPAVRAFNNAGLAFVLKKTPATRQLLVLQNNRGIDCAPGWFKNAQREQFAKFTNPIYRDSPQEALVYSAGAHRAEVRGDVVSVLSNKALRLLIKQSYSYGRDLDSLIEKHQPRRVTTTDENVLMVKGLAKGIADYMFIAPEEAKETISAAGYSPDQFKMVKLAHMPLGEYRYILCSQQTPDAVIQRLNSAIGLKPLGSPGQNSDGP